MQSEVTVVDCSGLDVRQAGMRRKEAGSHVSRQRSGILRGRHANRNTTIRAVPPGVDLLVLLPAYE